MDLSATRAGPKPGISRFLRPWLSLAIVCAGFSLSADFRTTFWSAGYLSTVLQQAVTNIILAVGMTFVILTGGIDLSVGSVAALCGIALGMTVQTGLPPFLAGIMALPLGVGAGAIVVRALPHQQLKNAPVSIAVVAASTIIMAWILVRITAGGVRLEWAILAALASGCGCGLMNGLAVSIGRVPPFIMTLGTMVAARSLTVYATNGNSISGLPPRLGVLGTDRPMIGIALACVLTGGIVLAYTRAGRYLYAIGGNEQASRLTGVDLVRYKTLAYVISGLMAGAAAIVLTAKFQLADTGAASGAELNAIAAVVIGGTSLSGGQGSVVGSLVGALTIAVLNAGLVLVHVKDTLQGVVIGAVIVVTVMIDQLQRR